MEMRYRIHCPVCGGLREPDDVLRSLEEPPLLDAVVQEFFGYGKIATSHPPVRDDTLAKLIDACEAALEHLEQEARRRGMQID